MSSSADPVAMRVAIAVVVLLCLLASGLFLFLDPGSLDVHLVYGKF